MIPFVYLIILVAFILIGISFYFKDYAISAIGSMLLMAIGIYILINGLAGINDFLTMVFGIVIIGCGAYILIRGGIESISD